MEEVKQTQPRREDECNEKDSKKSHSENRAHRLVSVSGLSVTNCSVAGRGQAHFQWGRGTAP